VVAELECRYRKGAHYDDRVTVWVRVASVASRSAVFEYLVADAGGGTLAEGRTRHVVVSRATGRPTVISEELRASLLRQPSTGDGVSAAQAGLSIPSKAKTLSGSAATHARSGSANVTGMSKK